MKRTDDVMWCDGCGVEISWAPLKIGNRHYCCEDCHEGRPCECGSRLEMEDERRAGIGQAASSE
jgi:hypothetical protein